MRVLVTLWYLIPETNFHLSSYRHRRVRPSHIFQGKSNHPSGITIDNSHPCLSQISSKPHIHFKICFGCLSQNSYQFVFPSLLPSIKQVGTMILRRYLLHPLGSWWMNSAWKTYALSYGQDVCRKLWNLADLGGMWGGSQGSLSEANGACFD